MRSRYVIDMLVGGDWVYINSYKDIETAKMQFHKIKKDMPRRIFRLIQVFSII